MPHVLNVYALTYNAFLGSVQPTATAHSLKGIRPGRGGGGKLRMLRHEAHPSVYRSSSEQPVSLEMPVIRLVCHPVSTYTPQQQTQQPLFHNQTTPTCAWRRGETPAFDLSWRRLWDLALANGDSMRGSPSSPSDRGISNELVNSSRAGRWWQSAEITEVHIILVGEYINSPGATSPTATITHHLSHRSMECLVYFSPNINTTVRLMIS